jgi:hypothetical protein
MKSTTSALSSTHCQVLTLSLIVHTEVGQSKLLDILLKRSTLCSTVRLDNERRDAFEILSCDSPERSQPSNPKRSIDRLETYGIL